MGINCSIAQTDATVLLPTTGHWKSTPFSAQIVECIQVGDGIQGQVGDGIQGIAGPSPEPSFSGFRVREWFRRG